MEIITCQDQKTQLHHVLDSSGPDLFWVSREIAGFKALLLTTKVIIDKLNILLS